RGLPDDTITPEVSLCRRMPDSFRPTSAATSACDPSCACVTTWRGLSHSGRTVTSTSATIAVPPTTTDGGGRSTVDTACQAEDTTSVNEVDTDHLPPGRAPRLPARR